MDFSYGHWVFYSRYEDNIVYLYNPSATMVLQNKDKKEYYFRRVDPSIDGASLTERGLYKIIGDYTPLSPIPDGDQVS